jgi:hypothetical protein
MTFTTQIDDIYKNLDDFKEIPFATNYLISKFGLVYNKKTKNYLTPTFHKSTNRYAVNLNTEPRQNQIKHLLYITYINPNLDLELLTNTSKFAVYIKNTNDDLPFINFTINDLIYESKSDNNKKQARNNRTINMYDLNYNFIKLYESKEDIIKEIYISDNSSLNRCLNRKNKTCKGFIFRYNDDDEYKYNIGEIKLMMFEDINVNHIEEIKQTLEGFENNLMIQEDININIYNFNIEDEIWKQLDNDDYSSENMNKNNPTLYEISNFGRYRSIRKIMDKRSKLFGTYKTKIEKLYLTVGYYYCHLGGKKDNGEKKIIKLRINKLVAKYFLTIPERLLNIPRSDIDVDHKDNNKLNNHYTNLQYLTKSENTSAKYRI